MKLAVMLIMGIFGAAIGTAVAAKLVGRMPSFLHVTQMLPIALGITWGAVCGLFAGLWLTSRS